jgi:hypothetical protein
MARIGKAQLVGAPADEEPGGNASVSASENDGAIASTADSDKVGAIDAGNAGGIAAGNAGAPASRIAGARAGRPAGRKAGKTRRRVGRPRGPERVPVTVRLRTETNDRLTAAVDSTGESPQYIVESALSAYLDALGIPGGGRRSASA